MRVRSWFRFLVLVCGSAGVFGLIGSKVLERANAAADEPGPSQPFLLVASPGSGNILKYDAITGTLQGVFATISGASDMTFGPDGNLYVISEGAIVKLNGSTGAGMGVFASRAALSPVGLAFGPEGGLFVLREATNEVLRFNGGTGAFMDVFIRLPDIYSDRLQGLTFGSDGALYVTGRNIYRYDGRSGDYGGGVGFSEKGLFRAPVFGPDGRLYAANVSTNQVVRFSTAPTYYGDVFASGGGLASPFGVTFGPDGNLYVASTKTDQVLRYNGTTGAFMDVFAAGGGLKGPKGIAFSPGGQPPPAAVSFTRIEVAVSREFTALTVGDLNNDGKPDLVQGIRAPDKYSNIAHLRILLGKGDGTFGSPSEFALHAQRPYDYNAAPSSPSALAVADFNRDGKPDVAAVYQDSGTVSILLGNGDGTFKPFVEFGYRDRAWSPSISAADLNGDGKMDLVVIAGGLYVLLGKGDGTFQPAKQFTVGSGPNSLALADFNRDGIPDVVTANSNVSVSRDSGDVSILLGKGDGSFGTALNIPFSGLPVSVAVGDLNGDGKADLAIGLQFSEKVSETRWHLLASKVAVLLGNGDGTFQRPREYSAGYGMQPDSPCIADFNGDGRADLARGSDTKGIAVMLGKGDGDFGQTVFFPLYFRGMICGDLNGDGKPDILERDGFKGINVLFNSTKPPALTITTASIMPSGVAGNAYSQPLVVSGGTPPYRSWAVTAGSLPPGLTLTAGPQLTGKPTAPGAFSFTLQVTDNAGATASKQFTLVIVPAPIAPERVVNAASLLPGPIAPGEIVTIFGAGIGPESGEQMRFASSGQVESTLVGVRVWFDGAPAPILFAQANQINAVVPYSVEGKTSTQLQIEYQGQKTNVISLSVTASAPALFTVDSSGKGPGLITNEDGSMNAASNPAERGSVVTLTATGEGQTSPPGRDGRIGSDTIPMPVLPVVVGINNAGAEVVSAGGGPGLLAGFLQIRVRVPLDASTGDAIPLVIKVGDAFSQPGVTMAIK